MDPHQQLNRILAEAGVSKIVYALVMPETESTIDAVFDGNDLNAGARARFHDLFREAWTQKQDSIHEGFFRRWKDWVQPVVALHESDFPFEYPTAGASEALRESIHALAARTRCDDSPPKIHVFHGEYEGFSAYAAAAGIEVCSHSRRNWQHAIERVGHHDEFYLSQPSAVDGFVWSEFERFAMELFRVQPTARIMLDLSYVGCIATPFFIDATLPNIGALFLSLSKPAGVYYHRIGGMLSRMEYPGLFGNKWFKNIASLAIGTEFMSRYQVQELPSKYRSVQCQAIDELNAAWKLALQPADIVLLGVGEPKTPPSELERFLFRGPPGEQKVRVCLTPRMAHAINPKLTPSVTARYYERLAIEPQ